jgi:hypothetical protein
MRLIDRIASTLTSSNGAMRRTTLILGLTLGLMLVVCRPVSAAADAPKWHLDALSNTTAQPGSDHEYFLAMQNVGDAATDGSEVSILASLPAGLTAREAVFWPDTSEAQEGACTAGDGFSPVSGATSVKCSFTGPIQPKQEQLARIVAAVEPGLEGARTAFFKISGGGLPTTTVVDYTRLRNASPPFGIDAFDDRLLDQDAQPLTQAGAHPTEFVASLDFNTATEPIPTAGPLSPIEPPRDSSVSLPPGLIGNPTSLATCTATELANSESITPLSLCPPASQLGTVVVHTNNLPPAPHARPSARSIFNLPLFNLEPPPGVAARFGFNIVGTVVVLDSSVRSAGDYGLTTGSRLIPQPVGLVGASFHFWGDPADPSHDLERACPGSEAPLTSPSSHHCPSEAVKSVAFFRTPTSCTEPGVGVATTAVADSWVNPGVFSKATSLSHLNPGYPYAPSEWGDAQGFNECSEEPFTPSLAAAPPSGAPAAKPTSFSFDLQMPQKGLEEPEAISESDLRKAVVTLPQGVRVNPSSADGLGSCSPAQIGLTTPVGDEHPHFTNDAGNCPEDSKLGNLQITTPLLDHQVPGEVYLAQQGQNPFGSLLALYLIAHDAQSGVNIKQAIKVGLDPGTGQLSTTVEEIPQLPFTNLHIELKSGPRAALIAPSCGTYATKSEFTGWSGKVVHDEASFKVDQGCSPGGFDPRLSAGTKNPLAGTYSPFSLRLTREDGTQELGGLTATLPPGITAKFAGIPYCPDAALASLPKEAGGEALLGSGAAQIASPSCSPASQLGTVTVGAGAGPTPFYTDKGRAYLAGPYKGAPLSIAVIAPAVAGPFDLGSVLVRNALYVDPATAQGKTVSDPFPTALHGIPLDLRDVRVDLSRPGFTLNPTSCEPKSVDASITSSAGATANRSQHFQAAACDRLAFKPKLSLRLKGGTKRGGHPALTATLTMPPGGANIAKVITALPHSEFLDQSHIGTVCTRVQFAADQCPAASVYGHARAITPLFAQPLEGPVYLRSSNHKLPDLVMALHGQVDVDPAARIDSVNGGIRASFEAVPDAPLTKVVLSMAGGKKGLLQNSTNLCARPHRASAAFDAQNGKVSDLEPTLKVKCAEARHRRHR